MIRSPAGFDGGDRIKRYLDYYQPSYGVMMLSAGQAFTPASLFAAGEQGAWYDPSDFSTMFQDNLGATPVTAVEQTVGRILDKSGRGNHATQATLANRPTLSARVNQLLATATLSTQSVTTLAATYTLAFSGAGTVTTSGTNIGVYTAGSNSLVCTAGTLTLTVVGSVTLADLRVTNDGVGLPAYQAVVTSTDYDTSGFPLYLRFDGSNDGLVTASINFSATDKMSVFAGMRKLSDVAQAAFIELSVTSASGTFTVFAPNVAAPNGDIVFRSRGTASSNAIAANVAPSTVVMSGLSSISTDISSIRLNGVLIQQNTTDQGISNFTNNPLYIGRRGGASLPYNGRLYSLIVRGAQSTATEIANTETWVNGKTLAY
jgi:hypothetical protein